MMDYLRDLDPVPRAVRRFVRERNSTVARLASADQVPSDSEVAAVMRMPVERYRQQSRIANAGSVLSYERADGTSRVDQIPDPDASTPFLIALKHGLADAITTLPLRERMVMQSILAGYAMKEIAGLLNVTPVRISQLKSRAMILLRISFGAKKNPSISETYTAERAS
jgi:DNA-directed RNA polymerase specialized sigma subunit